MNKTEIICQTHTPTPTHQHTNTYVYIYNYKLLEHFYIKNNNKINNIKYYNL